MTTSLPRSVLRNVTGASLLLLLCTGCGSNGELSGTVSYKGKPLKGGYVTFVAKDGGLTFPSPISSTGSYSIPKLPSGDYKVCVDTEFLKGDDAANSSSPMSRSGRMPMTNAKKPDAPQNEKDKKGGQSHAEAAGQTGYTPGPSSMAEAKRANLDRYTQIPLDYRKPETTRKEYTVTGGKAVYNVELD